jgi:CheY-like chemotaxis protein
MNNQDQQSVLLIVEDEFSIRRLWRDSLKNEGYNVIEARDGIKGFNLLKNEKPKLLILDLCMEPRGMDEGLYFLTKKSKNKDLIKIPVIIVSGAYTEEELEIYKNKFGDIRKIFIKPISEKDLTDSVNNILS